VIPNPIRSVSALDKLRSPEFVAELGEQDWWYGRQRYPKLRFPYSGILMNARIWMEAIYGIGSEEVDDLDPRPWERLWTEPWARELMFALLDQFAQEAEVAGAVPVVAILPYRKQLREYAEQRRVPWNVQRVLDYCESSGRICFDGVAALGRSVETKSEASALYAGHLNAEGNRLLGDAFADDLLERLPQLVAAQQPVAPP
jgi:hypothetical protein